jgi:L-lactate dehydrogenase (cytochrome)
MNSARRLMNCLNLDDLRRMAWRRLPRPIFDFLEGGADDEWTARRNLRAFDDVALTTRTLVDISTLDTRSRLFGQPIDWPVIIAPTGASQLFHHTAEPAIARAAANSGTLYTLSTMSNTSLEEIGALNDAPKVFQLYVFKDRSRVESLIDRCRRADYRALCLTVDTPLSGNRERDRLNGMSIPPRWTLKNLLRFAARPTWSLNAAFRCRYTLANFDDLASAGTGSTALALEYVNSQFDRTVTWRDAAWLAKLWNGPLAIKGILSAEDARRAVDVGATAVWVSNHGGRQLDGVPSAIECLPAVRAAVGGEIEIILDGGVRRGTHVLKALALGANACALGRPWLYGLAAAGEAGVSHALNILRSEFERDMALAGCAKLADIGPERLHASAPDRAAQAPAAPH